MVKCEICFEECQEGDLEIHREMCVIHFLFRCSLCCNDFLSKEAIWNHLDQHKIVDESKESHYQEIKANHKLHRCTLCNDGHAYLEGPYRKHIEDVHNGFFLKCSDCGEQFRSERLKNDHLLSHCQFRDQSVASNINATEEEHRLSDSYSTNGKAVSDQFACDTCGKIFLSNRLFVRHKRSCEKEILSEFRLADINGADEMDNSSSSELLGTKCSYCGKECSNDRNLSNHYLNFHKPTECNLCGTITNGVLDARHHKNTKHANPRYECVKCSEKFHRITDFNRHFELCDFVKSDIPSCKDSGQRTEKGSDPKVMTVNSSSETISYRCSHCGMEESNSEALIQHNLNHHDPVACDFCGITLPSLSEAQIHVQTKHKESQFKCPHCTTQFASTARLQQHITYCVTHTVPCDFCGRMYKSYAAANKHATYRCSANERNKNHRQKNAERVQEDDTDSSTAIDITSTPIVQRGLLETKCYYCEEELPSPGYLRRHMKIRHKLTKCDICGISVFGLTSARYHKVKYHTEIRYDCSTCGEKFSRKREYRNHCVVCKKKVNSCKPCRRTFKQWNLLKQHNEQYHPEESSSETLQNVEDRLPVQSNESEKEIAVEQPTGSPHDDRAQIKCNTSDSDSLIYLDDDEDHDFPMVSIPLLDSDNALSSQPPVGVSPNQLYSCDTCGMALSSYHQLDNHKRTVHMNKTFQCAHCLKKFHFRNKLEEHELHCSSLTHVCTLCGKKFWRVDQLESHKKRAHRNSRPLQNSKEENQSNMEETQANSMIAQQTNNLKLDIKVENTLLQDAKNHVSNKEFGRFLPTTPITSPKKEMNLSSYANSTKCSHCGQEESSADSLASHVLFNHDPVACDLCGITMSNYNEAQRHLITEHKEAKFKCPLCSMRIGWKFRYEIHLSNCEKEQTPCDFCGKMFQNEPAVNKHRIGACNEYRRHKRLQHTLDKPTLCESKCYYCNETFSGPGLVKHHMRTCHELTTCDVCEITVLGISSVRHHKLTNHKDPKYECRLCGRKFHHEKQHDRHHCRREPERKRGFQHYTLDETNMKYVLIAKSTPAGQDQSTASSESQVTEKESPEVAAASLNDSSSCQSGPKLNKLPQLRTVLNQPYSCNLCDYTATSYNAFQYHRVTKHTDGKFKCPHCARGFHHKRKYNKHLACCARLKVSCNLCGQKFNMESRLKPHMEQFHSGVGSTDYSKDHKQRPVRKKGAAQKTTMCNICKTMFASTKELTKHKKICSNQRQVKGKAQCSAQEGQPLNNEAEPQSSSVIEPQIKLEIDAEEPMLQKEQYLETPSRSFVTAVPSHRDEAKHAKATDAESTEYGIQIKQEHSGDDHLASTKHQSPTACVKSE